MLPLTLRPTTIGTPPAFQRLKDYCVFEDGEKIGRIYEVHAAARNTAEWWAAEWGFVFIVPVETNGACHEDALQRLIADIVRSAPPDIRFP